MAPAHTMMLIRLTAVEKSIVQNSDFKKVDSTATVSAKVAHQSAASALVVRMMRIIAGVIDRYAFLSTIIAATWTPIQRMTGTAIELPSAL